jgi:hypothetical protein
MSTLAIVRELVKKLMQADADDEELYKRKPQMRKLPDEDDDDPVDRS